MRQKMNYKKDDLIIFQDSVGHLSIGTFIEDNEGFIKVKNPLYITTVNKPDGKTQIVFPEWVHKTFFADINQDRIWSLSKQQYSFMDTCEYDVQLTSIYKTTVSPIKKEDLVKEPTQEPKVEKTKKSSVGFYDT